MILDARVLKDEFIPKEVVHRDPEVDEISRTLEPLVEGNEAENLLVVGPSGAGKTCISRHVLERLEEEMLDVRHYYINCWENYNRFRVLYKALEGLGKTLDVHRQSTPTDELMSRLRRHTEEPYVLVLDEVDQLEDQKVLYDLYSTENVYLLMIANREEDVFFNMEERIRSRLMSSRRIRFEKYGTRELTDILRDRAEWGLEPRAFEEEELELIAERSAGDARIAIGTLRASARRAEEEEGKITPDVIEDALPEAREYKKQKSVEKMNEHQQRLYEIIEEREEVAPRELYESYREGVEDPRSERMLRKYLNKMEHYNLIRAEGEGRGRTYALEPTSNP